MKKINVLLIVDAAGALSSSTIKNNVYMVDTNQWLGSWQEGTCQLHTLSEDGQMINWRATAVESGQQIMITGFSGKMVDDAICTPQMSSDEEWESRVETRGGSGRYPYTISLTVDGTPFSFSPFLDVQ